MDVRSFNSFESAPKIPQRLFSGKPKARIHFFDTCKEGDDKYAIAAEKLKHNEGTPPPQLGWLGKKFYIILQDKEGTYYKVNKASLKARLCISEEDLENSSEDDLTNAIRVKVEILKRTEKEAQNLREAQFANKLSSFKWKIPTVYPYERNEYVEEYALQLKNEGLEESKIKEIGDEVGDIAVEALGCSLSLENEEIDDQINDILAYYFIEIAKVSKPEVTVVIFDSILNKLSLYLERNLDFKEVKPYLIHCVRAVEEGLDNLLSTLPEEGKEKFNNELQKRLDDKGVLHLLEASYLVSKGKINLNQVLEKTSQNMQNFVQELLNQSEKI